MVVLDSAVTIKLGPSIKAEGQARTEDPFVILLAQLRPAGIFTKGLLNAKGEQKGNNYRKHEKPSPGCQVPKVQVSDPLVMTRRPKGLGQGGGHLAWLPLFAALVAGAILFPAPGNHLVTRGLCFCLLSNLPHPRPPTGFWSLARSMSLVPWGLAGLW